MDVIDGVFSSPVLSYEPPNPDNLEIPTTPADPSMIEIFGKLHMYYGYHTKGIYYSVYQ